MIKLGDYNELEILRDTSVGLFLGDDEENDLLLPNKYVPENWQIGDKLKVFVYKDSEDRIIATTLRPKIIVGKCAALTCEMTSNLGAFMDMGLEKQLFVPFKEQGKKMVEGSSYVVTMYVDEETDRLVGSSRLKRHLSNDELTVEEGDEVEVMIWNITDLGYNVVVNNKHIGLIYQNEIFKEVWPGDIYEGHVHKIREDNKLDIKLGKKGYAKVEPNAEKILMMMRLNGGVLHLTDKSDPDLIREELGMSKKTFKKAVGALYRQKLIELRDEELKIVEDQD